MLLGTGHRRVFPPAALLVFYGGALMELLDSLRSRHSTRLFTDEPLSDDEILKLCDAAALAPSQMNSQPWHFHVATGQSRAEVGEIMALTTQYLQEYIEVLGVEGVERAARFYEDMGRAPVIIAVSIPVFEDQAEHANALIAVGAAIENFMLAALDSGLGSCNISAPRWIVDRLTEAFQVPAGRVLASLLIVGHPDEAPLVHDRKHDAVTFLGR
ncbi:MAG: hypothetical protein CVT59_09055 [Actinobacteria bacterium HGW-Actinobacteria-1]|nr:MAG: hypothetical protein CVT59_09055 [Actinobacteria bacterium HGW-Actinobacteria-1]